MGGPSLSLPYGEHEHHRRTQPRSLGPDSLIEPGSGDLSTQVDEDRRRTLNDKQQARFSGAQED